MRIFLLRETLMEVKHLLIFFCIATPSFWSLYSLQEPRPGEQFQVNSYTSSTQAAAAVDMASDGSFVIVWHSLGSAQNDSDSFSIQGQRFGKNGSPLGSQFQVNAYTSGYQTVPDIAISPSGDFVIVWQSEEGGGSDPGPSIQGRRFSTQGTPLGSQFQVNSYTTGGQVKPAVDFDSSGNFIVLWHSLGGSVGSDNDLGSIQGRRFSASGSPLTGDFQINTYGTESQLFPVLAPTPEGGFIAAWHGLGSAGTDNDAASVHAQRVGSDNSLLGKELQVNTLTTSFQADSAIDTDREGNFVIVWQSFSSTGNDTEDTSIQVRRFLSNGTPVGTEFQVNTSTIDYQRPSKVAVDDGGRFVVIWESESSQGADISERSILGQWFQRDGLPIGNEFEVNSFTLGSQEEPEIVIGNGGTFVAVWESEESASTDTDNFSIQARVFETSLFVDGFESGDTSGWSNAVP